MNIFLIWSTIGLLLFLFLYCSNKKSRAKFNQRTLRIKIRDFLICCLVFPIAVPMVIALIIIDNWLSKKSMIQAFSMFVFGTEIVEEDIEEDIIEERLRVVFFHIKKNARLSKDWQQHGF